MLIGLKNYIRIYRVQNGLKLQNSMAPSGTISFYSLFIAYFKNGIMYLIGRKTEWIYHAINFVFTTIWYFKSLPHKTSLWSLYLIEIN